MYFETLRINHFWKTLASSSIFSNIQQDSQGFKNIQRTKKKALSLPFKKNNKKQKKTRVKSLYLK